MLGLDAPAVDGAADERADLANRVALLHELDAYTEVLARLRTAIEAGDGAALEAVFARSRVARSQWQEQRAAGGAGGDVSK